MALALPPWTDDRRARRIHRDASHQAIEPAGLNQPDIITGSLPSPCCSARGTLPASLFAPTFGSNQPRPITWALIWPKSGRGRSGRGDRPRRRGLLQPVTLRSAHRTCPMVSHRGRSYCWPPAQIPAAMLGCPGTSGQCQRLPERTFCASAATGMPPRVTD